jgi:hypothetical protein
VVLTGQVAIFYLIFGVFSNYIADYSWSIIQRSGGGPHP